MEEEKNLYDTIAASAEQLADVVQEAFGSRVCVNRIGSLMSVFFQEGAVTDYASAVKSDTGQYAAYFNYMLNQGIYLAPSQFEAMFLSYAHTKEDIERTCDVILELAKNNVI